MEETTPEIVEETPAEAPMAMAEEAKETESSETSVEAAAE